DGRRRGRRDRLFEVRRHRGQGRARGSADPARVGRPRQGRGNEVQKGQAGARRRQVLAHLRRKRMAHKELKFNEDARRALERGIEQAVDLVVEDLKKQSKQISGKEDIARVATISAREREIGDVIADAIEKVGKDGVVNVEEGQTFGLELEFTEGMQFDKGYLSPYMITDAERMEAVLEDPYILVANQKIGAVKDLLPILEQVIQAGKPLLIVAEDVEGESL